MIDSACSGPDYCTNASNAPAPDVEQILQSADNDGIVPLASQTAGCVAPCQVVTFGGLAHTKVPDLGVAGYIFNNRNVENNPSVNGVISCWLSTAGAPSCGQTAQVAHLEEVAFVPTDSPRVNEAPKQLAVSPPIAAQLAVPFDVEIQVNPEKMSGLTVQQTDELGHHTEEEELMLRNDQGHLVANIVPVLMGRVTYLLRARFSDGGMAVNEFSLLVRPPTNPPREFHANAGAYELVVCLERGCDGGDLHYDTDPTAVFDSAPGVKIHLDGWVTYKLLPADGLPAIRLNKGGSFDSLRAGRAVVEERFGSASDRVVIVVKAVQH